MLVVEQKEDFVKGKEVYPDDAKGFCPKCRMRGSKRKKLVHFKDTDESAFICLHCNVIWNVEKATFI